MSFFGGAPGSPFMTYHRSMNVEPADSVLRATYQNVLGPLGLPQLRLELTFSSVLPVVTNPHMGLALLLDRSGSMTETYRDGHVFGAANSVLQLTGRTGFDLAFYDTAETDAGHISTSAQLRDAVTRNAPRGGGTALYATLRKTIAQLRQQRQDAYVIVVTDGEFSDKAQVQHLIVNEVMPSLPKDRPNALRVHFIGAGGEVDREFLQQLEAAASNSGAPVVRQHTHEHIRHSHTDIARELSGIYLGVGTNVRLTDQAQSITRAGFAVEGLPHDGPAIESPFLPRIAQIAIEYAVPHPAALALELAYADARGASASLRFRAPLPKATRTHAPRASAPLAGAGTTSVTASDGSAWLPPELGKPRRPHFRNPFVLSPERKAQRAAIAELSTARRHAEIARQAADLKALAAGGIPVSARERLEKLKADAGAFTSDLAPEELGLLRSKGMKARGLVTGSAMYHVGVAYASSTNDCEVRVLSEAYMEATRLAVSRMTQELHILGAHGAVGVRLTMTRHEWADKTVEVQIIGTAVDGPGPPPKTPWLSDLSGQEWYALNRAGYDPVGFVYGHCTWFVLTTPYDEYISQSWSNTELVHHSQGISQARHIALRSVTQQAKAAGASGVTGVHIAHRVEEVRLSGPDENPIYELEHHNVTISILGTAIALRRDAPQMVGAARIVLSLRDNRIVPLVVNTAAAADFE